MFIQFLVNSDAGGGFDIIWILLPLLCCVMMMGQSRGSGGGGSQQQDSVTESWYTVQSIDEAYGGVQTIAAEWRKEAEERDLAPKSFVTRLRGVLGGRRTEARYVEREAISPKLYRMSDPSGPIYFELTEVEGGGTVVKATYGPAIKNKMAKYRATLPIKIPATPIGSRCPTCGKPVLPEFSLCPYCGEKIIKG